MSERRPSGNLSSQLIRIFHEARRNAPTDAGKRLGDFSLLLETDPVISETWNKIRKSPEVAKIIRETPLNNQDVLVEALRKTLAVDRQTYQDGEMSGREG